MIGHNDGNHAACDPDHCFQAKLAYWRTNGGLSVRIPEGWGGESWMSKQKKVIGEALDNGYEPEKVR